MNKYITGIIPRLETIIDGLSEAISPVDSKERVCIICEQITALRGIQSDILKDGVYNG